MRVVSFTPIKGESQRLPKKNTREFAGLVGGLSALKLRQLSRCSHIDNYVVNTDAPWVLIFGDTYLTEAKVLRREKKYTDRDLPTPGMHQMAIENLEKLGYNDKDVVVWAQVTSPLFYEKLIDDCIQTYLSMAPRCLQTVTPINGFYIEKETGKSLNWDREKEGNWPRSQTMTSSVSLDNALSIISFEEFRAGGDRMGANPYYYTSPGMSGWDIDTHDDFRVAEFLYNTRHGRKYEDNQLQEQAHTGVLYYTGFGPLSPRSEQ